MLPNICSKGEYISELYYILFLFVQFLRWTTEEFSLVFLATGS